MHRAIPFVLCASLLFLSHAQAAAPKRALSQGKPAVDEIFPDDAKLKIEAEGGAGGDGPSAATVSTLPQG